MCQDFSLCAKQPNNDKIIVTIVIGSVVTVGIICYAAFKCFKKKPKYEYIERAVDTMIQTKKIDRVQVQCSLNDSQTDIKNTQEDESIKLIQRLEDKINSMQEESRLQALQA